MNPDSEEYCLKVQLVALLNLSNDAARETDPIARRRALEHMQGAIQSARPMIALYAQDIMEALEA